MYSSNNLFRNPVSRGSFPSVHCIAFATTFADLSMTPTHIHISGFPLPHPSQFSLSMMTEITLGSTEMQSLHTWYLPAGPQSDRIRFQVRDFFAFPFRHTFLCGFFSFRAWVRGSLALLRHTVSKLQNAPFLSESDFLVPCDTRYPKKVGNTI